MRIYTHACMSVLRAHERAHAPRNICYIWNIHICVQHCFGQTMRGEWRVSNWNTPICSAPYVDCIPHTMIASHALTSCAYAH